VIVEGYYEWTPERVPYVFRPKKKMSQGSEEDKPLHCLLAGLYANDGTFVILTRSSIGDAQQAHSRMPVILSEEEVDKWLNCDKYKYEDIQASILDETSEKWKSTFSYQLDTLVNNAANKTEDVLKRADDYDAKAEGSTIKKFFSSSAKKSQQNTHEFEMGRRGDETDDEEDVEDESQKKVEEEVKQETREEEEEPQKKKVSSIKKSQQATPLVTPVKMKEGGEEKIHIQLQSKGKEKVDASGNKDEGKRSKEIEDVISDIRNSLEKSEVKLGADYKVAEAILVVEKADDKGAMEQEGKENVSVNVGTGTGKKKESKSSSKKRKDFPGKDKDNEFNSERKKHKASPNPFGVRN